MPPPVTRQPTAQPRTIIIPATRREIVLSSAAGATIGCLSGIAVGIGPASYAAYVFTQHKVAGGFAAFGLTSCPIAVGIAVGGGIGSCVGYHFAKRNISRAQAAQNAQPPLTELEEIPCQKEAWTDPLVKSQESATQQ